MKKKPKRRPARPPGNPPTLNDVIITVVTAPPRTLDDITVKKGATR